MKGFIVPPIVDSHLHVASLSFSLLGTDLRGSKSIWEILRRLSDAGGSIVYGRGQKPLNISICIFLYRRIANDGEISAS